jgi:tRNA(fMet)-specific endonuclease VapC
VFLLDTDHLVILQRQVLPEWERMRSRMLAYDASDFYLSVVSFHEQALGAHTFISRARGAKMLVRGYQMLEQCLIDFGRFNVVSFDEPATKEFEALRAAGVRIGTMDLRIAAIARSHNMTVLTRNTVDFDRVPELPVADWTLPL